LLAPTKRFRGLPGPTGIWNPNSDDISVAGFNDTIGEVLHPGLTTVREFPKELGGHLAEFTFRRIHEPDLPRSNS